MSAVAATSCPPPPADYTGSDQTLDELRDTRIDAATACAAEVERLESLSAGLTDVQTAVEAARTTDTVSLSGTDRQQAEDIQGALHADLWFLSGLLAAVLVGGIVARELLWR